MPSAQRALGSRGIDQNPSGIHLLGKIPDLLIVIRKNADGMTQTTMTVDFPAHFYPTQEILNFIPGQNRCQNFERQRCLKTNYIPQGCNQYGGILRNCYAGHFCNFVGGLTNYFNIHHP